MNNIAPIIAPNIGQVINATTIFTECLAQFDIAQQIMVRNFLGTMISDYIIENHLYVLDNFILRNYTMSHTSMTYNLLPWSPGGQAGIITQIQENEISDSLGDFLVLICIVADATHIYHDNSYVELLNRHDKVLMIATVLEGNQLVSIVIMRDAEMGSTMLEPSELE